jgi:EF-P beta-lysylation protein EpmB
VEKSAHGSGAIAVGNGFGSHGEARWQRLLAEAIRDPDELLTALGLPDALRDGARESAQLFPLLVPRGFAALMTPGDAADPLLRQVLPLAIEGEPADGYVADPLHEGECAPLPGLLHKYQGRVLLVATGACAVHCRYCFRRHFPYQERARGPAWWRAARDYVAARPDIDEILLSGGDPLTLPDAQLAALAADFAQVPHLRRLRIHSRLPIVLPERVDDALLAWFGGGRLRPVLVVHANHPREISPAVVAACRRLGSAGVAVLNQSVLLRGVNDEVRILDALSRTLFDAGVQPYYLHQLDRVAGAAHFAVSDDRARHLARALAEGLPGYLVPRLVRELPGHPGKTPL